MQSARLPVGPTPPPRPSTSSFHPSFPSQSPAYPSSARFSLHVAHALPPSTENSLAFNVPILSGDLVGGAPPGPEGGLLGTSNSHRRLLRGDRFIPNPLPAVFHLHPSPVAPVKVKPSKRKRVKAPMDTYEDEMQSRFASILRSELVDAPLKRSRFVSSATSSLPSAPSTPRSGSLARRPSSIQPTPLFSFATPSRQHPPTSTLESDIFSSSPLSRDSQAALTEPRTASRLVNKTPYRVLDAPGLQDDYYSRALDWSAQNVLGVALGSTVYSWTSGTVSKLQDLSSYGSEVVTSIKWMSEQNALAVGTRLGFIDIVDPEQRTLYRRLSTHEGRVAALDWSSKNRILTSGAHDKAIQHHDLRVPQHVVASIVTHAQEVCGLKWSSAGELASGGNDNKLCIFKGLETKPLHVVPHAHSAAIRALDWSPHDYRLLCTGGGTNDGKLRFWRDGRLISEVDSGGQVCDMLWSKNSNELVSAHGYREDGSDGRIYVWKYGTGPRPTLVIAALTGHSRRVLHLALSPDGQSIASGSGDETLRFWSVFPPARSTKSAPRRSLLDATALIR
ncbi:hypothetical protein JCM10213_004793 [Rhodosporidiobolus nylandii]